LLRMGAGSLSGRLFFVLLAPSSRVVPIVEEWAAERRVYLASAGPQILVLLAAYYGLVNVSGAGKRVVLMGIGAGFVQRTGVGRRDLGPQPQLSQRVLALAHELPGNTDTAIDCYQRTL